MSKSGSNFYYIQDELGSPMYMTGTDGATVSSYAYDDFGRNIDPFTGKIRNNRNQNASKHAYTTNGNIIQPFAFTGYQEDEVSGLKFAQARFYKAETGRFQSEDNIKGFIESPFTINHYSYCWGNPIGIIDRDGNMAEWVANAADKISKAGSAIGNIINENKTAVGIGLNVVGVVAGAAVTAFAGPVVGGAVSGAIMNIGTQISEKGTDINWGEVAINAVSGAAGGMVGAKITQTFGSIFLGATIDAATDILSKRVNGETMDFEEVVASAGSNLLSNSIGAGIGHEVEKVIDYRKAKKFADAEMNLIAQERLNMRKCERICDMMEVEVRKADMDAYWAQMGRTAKQRNRALSGVTRHNRNAETLQRSYLRLVTESRNLRAAYNNTVDEWLKKMTGTTDNLTGGVINLVKNIYGMNHQEECA